MTENDKEKRDIDINMAFVVIAGVLGIFLNVFANAIYDVLIDGTSIKLLKILICSGVGSFIFIDFFSFVLDLKNHSKNLTFVKMFVKYLKYKFKSNENHNQEN